MDKWVCKQCGQEVLKKPHKNATCKCGGRFRRYTQCATCGAWFLNPYGKKYCTTDHWKRPTHKCEVCGKQTVNKRFCSMDCRRVADREKRIERTCLECGRKFDIPPSVLKTNASGNFCCRECYNKFLLASDGKMRWSGEFDRAKKKYFSGLQFCAVCGTTHNLQIHHIIPKRLTDDNRKENLIPLCRKHHAVVEHLTREIIAQGADEEHVETMYLILPNILRSQQIVTLTEIKNRANESKRV